MIITREIINKNIKFHEIEINGRIISFNYEDLSNAIDLYKNFLLDNNVKPQESVSILESTDIWQISALFACYELGLKVVVYDYIAHISDNMLKENSNFKIDSKTKSLLPINYILLPNNNILNTDITSNNKKSKYCIKFADTTLIRNFGYKNLQIPTKKNNTIYAKPNYVATKSTTSGTISAPKCIEHTHNFLYSLTYRNCDQFHGKYASSYNLNHGSSIFCYIIPSMVSKKITDIYFLPFQDTDKLLNTIDKTTIIDNLLVPYSSKIDEYFSAIKNYELKSMQNTIFHVLCNIKQEWVDDMYKTGRIKDIVSNFGSNETTGPIFLNKASDENFSEISYKLVDDYFKVSPIEKTLRVHLPIYNKTVTMNDYFTIENSRYIHNGRSDLLRINDLEIPLKMYTDQVNGFLNGELFYDLIKSEIYLAIWKTSDDIEHRVKLLDEKLRGYSNKKHYISKYSILDYSSFLNGIKLDKEMIREYFRDPNEDYKKLNQA